MNKKVKTKSYVGVTTTEMADKVIAGLSTFAGNKTFVAENAGGAVVVTVEGHSNSQQRACWAAFMEGMNAAKQ